VLRIRLPTPTSIPSLLCSRSTQCHKRDDDYTGPGGGERRSGQRCRRNGTTESSVFFSLRETEREKVSKKHGNVPAEHQCTSTPSDRACRTRGSHPAPGFPAPGTGSGPRRFVGGTKGKAPTASSSARHRRIVLRAPGKKKREKPQHRR
jgi:hypothetical protein